MKLCLQRQTSTSKSTPGKLFVNGKFECFTLEDVVRPAGVKVWGKTAIPPGTYSVLLGDSPHFGRIMPRLQDVPNFEGILIHYGNTDADTDGCVLVGDVPTPDFLGQSRVAFDRLFAKLQAIPDAITIEIREAS